MKRKLDRKDSGDYKPIITNEHVGEEGGVIEHGAYSGVVDIARNGVDESTRLGRQVDELAMLVARLARSLKFASPGSDLAGQAMDYLRRNNLQGAIMRAPTPVDPQSLPLPGCSSASGS